MKYIFKELNRHRWRTILSIAGYLIATLFILLIIAVTENNEKDSIQILKGTGTHFIMYVPSGSPSNSIPFQNVCCIDPADSALFENNKETDGNGKSEQTGSLYADGVYTKLLSRNFLNQIKQVEGVKEVAPYLLYKMFVDQFDSEITIGGINTENMATFTNVTAPAYITDGKFLSTGKDEILAEESFAQAFNLNTGDLIEINGNKLNLIGIVNSGVRPGKADLYSTFTNLKSILKDDLSFNMSGYDMNVILVEVEDSRVQNEVIEKVKLQNQYASVSTYNCFKPAASVMAIMDKASAILYGLIFIFLIIFAAKTQTTSLVERMREIGILKSLGWSNNRLGGQIIGGSVIQAFAGSVLGSLLAMFILFIFKSNDLILIGTSNISVKLYQIILVILFSLSGGVIASLFPIFRIYSLKAGQIMRNYV